MYRVLIAALSLAACAAVAHAQPTSPCSAQVKAMLLAEDADRAVLNEILAEAEVRGIPALNAHFDELKGIVERAPASDIPACDGVRYVRSSGSAAASLLAAAGALKASPGQDVRVLAISPYVAAAGLVGSLYVQRQQWDKADRAMQAGLALAPTDVRLVNEDSLALARLHRNPEALTLLDRALANADSLSPENRARLLRDKGYSLGELGRFDEAIAAYQQSLALTPGNTLALNEIAYLTKRKAGAPSQPTTILSGGQGVPPSH